MSKKLLIIRPDRAGDALKTLPTVRALVASHPDWQIELLASEFNSSLFTFEPGIKLHTLPLNWEKWDQPELRYQAEKILQKPYDAAVLLPCDRDGHADRLFQAVEAEEKWSLWSTHGKVFTWNHVAHDERDNIAQLVAKVVGSPVPWKNFSAAPVLNQHDRNEASGTFEEKAKGSRYVLCPFASMSRRSLPESSVITLIRKLAGAPQTQSVVLPGIASDYERFESLRRKAGVGEKLVTIYPTSFRSLAAYLEKCSGLVGVDSGPLHLAIAMELPVLGFLAGCDRARWYPMNGPTTHLVHRGYFGKFPSRIGLQWSLSQWLKVSPNQARMPMTLQGPVPVLF